MAKLPRLNAEDAEKLLLKAGFVLLRSKGSHRIYLKGAKRIIIPFHPGKTLHPKVVKQVLKTVEAVSTWKEIGSGGVREGPELCAYKRNYEHEISAYIRGKTGVVCRAYADYEELEVITRKFMVGLICQKTKTYKYGVS